MRTALVHAGIVVAPLALGCRAPTQVTVEVTTDLTCGELRGATVTVGAPGQIEDKAPAAVTEACADGDPVARVGSIVVVPSDAKDDAFAVKVVGGVDGEADACAPPDYAGCVVARREMRFVPHTELYLPVALRGLCKDLPCDASTTCVLGQCVPAIVVDPGTCAEPEACDEGALDSGERMSGAMNTSHVAMRAPSYGAF